MLTDKEYHVEWVNFLINTFYDDLAGLLYKYCSKNIDPLFKFEYNKLELILTLTKEYEQHA